MRSLICLALIALASTVSAGSIRPAACTTSTDEDPGLRVFMRDLINAPLCLSVGLPKNCTDAEIKLKNPALTVRPNTAAGYQSYSDGWYCSTVHDHAKQGLAVKTSKGLADAYLAATPAEQAQVDAILKIVTP